MATTKIWAIKDSVERVLNYAANPEKTVDSDLKNAIHYAENEAKTENRCYVTGVNCNAKTAFDEMKAVQERFGKTSGNVAYHAYQSFKTGEITPELCHKIGVELAKKMWGKLLRVNKSRTGSRKDITTQITTPKTESSNRKIPLNDTVLEALRAEKKRQDEHAEILGNGYDKSSSFIIRTVLGKPYVNLSAINRVVNRLTEKAGLPHCTIHGFRHSVASILDDNGVPIQDISVLLGHESVQTTERIYINRRKTAKAETIETLDNAINFNIA